MKKKFLELLKKGMNYEEAMLEIASDTEVKATPEELSAAYLEAKKAFEASKLASKSIEEDEEAKKLEAKVKASVDAVLESTGVKGLLERGQEKEEVKYFSMITGKSEGYKGMSDARKSVADALYYKLVGDIASLNKVCEDVKAQNIADAKQLGLSMKTALYTDATTGSYLIPTEVASEIMQLTYEQSQMLSKCNRNNVVFNSKLYPIMVDVSFATITDESTQIGDKTPTISNPTIAMSRYGGMAYISNELIKMRSPEVVTALMNQFASANARHVDLAVPCFSVTTNSDPFNGIAFDTLTAGVTSKALVDITEADLLALIAAISEKTNNITFMANRKVRNAFGAIKNAAGNSVFPDFVNSGVIAPYGNDFIVNSAIPSTMQVLASSGNVNRRTGGTSDIIIAADLSMVSVGIDDLAIDMSRDLKFDYDQTAYRAVGRIGSKVLSGTSTSGVVAAVQELTN
jgi:HK97 family phage major capsid protein